MNMPAVCEDITEVTGEILREVLPRNSTQEFADNIAQRVQKLLSDEEPEFRDNLRDNIIGYADIVKQGRYKITDYLNAVRFVSWRLADNTFEACYKRTFPDRYQRLLDDGRSKKEISSYVSAYSNNKLVVALLEQSLTPSYILNADVFQKAINTQLQIMQDEDVSHMVRVTAADSLLKHLKQPETAKIELDLKVDNADAMNELREVTRSLREAQRSAIVNNEKSVIDVAHTRILTPKEES